MTRRPCEPTPIKAMLTLSLGGTKPGPPKTWRGRMEKARAVPALCSRNLRRPTLVASLVLAGGVIFILHLEQREDIIPSVRAEDKRRQERKGAGFCNFSPFLSVEIP